MLNDLPIPVVVVASSVHATDTNLAFNAIQAGALTMIENPHGRGGKITKRWVYF